MKKIWNWLVSPTVAGVVGIFGLAIGLYATFFYERKPEIHIAVGAMSKVYDLYQPVGGLDVSYMGESLRTTKKNLWVLTVTIKNVGNAGIRKADYDDKVPLGLEVNGAVIAETPTLKTNVDYLAKNLKIASSVNQITFEPVIFEAGDSFEISTLLLGSESDKPSIKPIGKLAGIKSISLTTPESPSSEISIWSQAIEASSLLVHVIRVFIYFWGSIILAAILMATLDTLWRQINKYREKRKIAERKYMMQNYRKNEELGKEGQYLKEVYIAQGSRGIISILKYCGVMAKRQHLLNLLTDKIDSKEVNEIVRSVAPINERVVDIEEKLKAAGIMTQYEVKVWESHEFKNSLKNICDFLNIDTKNLSLERRNRPQLKVSLDI